MEVHCMLSRPEGMGGNNDSEGQNHSRSRKPKQVRQLKLALGPRSSDLVACGLGTDELFGHSYANGVGDCKEEVSVSIIPLSPSLCVITAPRGRSTEENPTILLLGYLLFFLSCEGQTSFLSLF